MTDDDLYDVAQAAAYLTVARSTLYREVARGRIRKQKVGGSTRFRRSELDRYLDAQQRIAGRGRLA